jgi:hypothetical protein
LQSQVIDTKKDMASKSAPSFPANWVKVGYVYLDPRDKYTYPEELFTVDPNEYVPRFSPCRDWGLQDPDEETGDEKVMMARMTAKQTMQIIYSGKSTPFEQYAAVLGQRKLAAVNCEVVQAAMKATLKLRSKLPTQVHRIELIILTSTHIAVAVSLTESDEVCWREFIVPAATTLAVLHDQIIGPIMGWGRAYHGYMFHDPVDGAVLGPKKHPGFVDMMHARIKFNAYVDDRKMPLASILRKVGDYCWYTYDLGNHWEHRIEVVEVLMEGADGYGQVQLLSGAGACPPEDSRGLEGMGCSSYAAVREKYARSPQECAKQLKGASGAKNYDGKPFSFVPDVYDLNYHRSQLAALYEPPVVVDSVFLSAQQNSQARCWKCDNREKTLSKCSQCNVATYCCRECQVGDWKSHKAVCKGLAAAALAAAAGKDTIGSAVSPALAESASASEPKN